MAEDDLVAEGGSATATSIVQRYFFAKPDVAAAMREAGARVVIFEASSEERFLPERFSESMQRALDVAGSRLRPGDRPLFVGYTTVPEIAEVPHVQRLSSQRGPFVGYLAIGEGGLVFFDSHGSPRGRMPEDEVVFEALRWSWP